MRESELVSLVTISLKRSFPGCYINKNHGNQFVVRGRPDIEGCIFGRHFGFELKAGSGFKPEQKSHIMRIHKAGGIAGGIVEHKHIVYFINAEQVQDYSLYNKNNYIVIGNDKEISLDFLYKYLPIFFPFYHGEIDALHDRS